MGGGGVRVVQRCSGAAGYAVVGVELRLPGGTGTYGKVWSCRRVGPARGRCEVRCG